MKMNFRKQKKEGAILRIRFLSFLRLLCGKKKSFEKCNTKVLNSIKSVLLIFFNLCQKLIGFLNTCPLKKRFKQI